MAEHPWAGRAEPRKGIGQGFPAEGPAPAPGKSRPRGPQGWVAVLGGGGRSGGLRNITGPSCESLPLVRDGSSEGKEREFQQIQSNFFCLCKGCS